MAASSPHPLPPIAKSAEATITLSDKGIYYVWWAKEDTILITPARTLEEALSIARNYFVGKRT